MSAAGPMPAGIGLHPYFVRTDRVTLRAGLDHVWLADEGNIPKERAAVPAAWDFADDPPRRDARARPLLRRLGWSGGDPLARGRSSLRIEAEPVFGHLVVYVPRGQVSSASSRCRTPTTGSTCSIAATIARRPRPGAGGAARRHGPLPDRVRPPPGTIAGPCGRRGADWFGRRARAGAPPRPCASSTGSRPARTAPRRSGSTRARSSCWSHQA